MGTGMGRFSQQKRSNNRHRPSQQGIITPTKTPTQVKPPAFEKDFTEPVKLPELSERDVAFLSSQTNLKPDDIVRWHKKFFRDNPSGRLDLAGFCKLYCLLTDKTPERINEIGQHIFRAFDSDRNGYVEFGEFLLGFAVYSHGDLRARLAYTFECYDVDSNGYLTEDEIKLVLRSMYTLLDIKHVQDYLSDLVAKDLMKKLDTSNDGRVTRDEFINVLLNDPVCRTMMDLFSL